MSQEKVLNTLVGLGLSKLDSQVYVCLAKTGSLKGIEISRHLKIQKQLLYPALKNLQSKGIVNATLERPARFSAIPFEKVVDLFVKAKIDEAQRIEESKKKLFESWRNIATSNNKDSSAKFNVIEGRGYIYSKLLRMVQESSNQISAVSTVPGLVRADNFGLFEAAFKHPKKSKIHFRFLTELTQQDLPAIKNILRSMIKAKFGFSGRTPSLGLTLFPQMFIIDSKEALFLHYILKRTK